MTHCDGCCHGNPTASVNQTMDEMEFERGLWSAAVDGDIDKCHQLINSGKDVNETDSSGYTALVSYNFIQSLSTWFVCVE